jgi:hypothetical protein
MRGVERIRASDIGRGNHVSCFVRKGGAFRVQGEILNR